MYVAGAIEIDFKYEGYMEGGIGEQRTRVGV